jgi:hypothetical protein
MLRSATEVQQKCNRSATEVQQKCNRSATGMQRSARIFGQTKLTVLKVMHLPAPAAGYESFNQILIVISKMGVRIIGCTSEVESLVLYTRV